MTLSRIARKRTLFVIGAAGATLVFAAGGAYLRQTAKARAGIERALSHILQTKVSVGGVELLPWSGRAVVTGLRVANPHGYGGGDAFSAERIVARFDARSFRTPQPLIHEIEVQTPRLALVQRDGESNLTRLIASAARLESDEPSANVAPRESRTPARVERLTIAGGVVFLTGPAVGAGRVSMALPPIDLCDPAGAPEGFAMARAAGSALTAMVEESARVAREQLGPQVSAPIGRSLERVTAAATAAAAQRAARDAAAGERKDATATAADELYQMRQDLFRLIKQQTQEQRAEYYRHYY